MKLISITSITIITFILSFQSTIAQGEEFTCRNDANNFLENTIGTWHVITKDRISIGKFENNEGTSTFTNSIEGCGVKESFRGTYRNKPYAREVIITGLDSMHVEMITLDSEHGSFSYHEGSVKNNKMTTYWYRNKDKKKLQSKYILSFKDTNNFEFSSFLSQDYGKNWDLTHKREYQKIEQD